MHLLPTVIKTYGWQAGKFYKEAMQIMTYWLGGAQLDVKIKTYARTVCCSDQNVRLERDKI